jgi:hypothetical protein
MGDRANIRLIQPDNKGSIYIYSHWNGSTLPMLLQQALERAKPRWGDAEYLNRILIDQITKEGRDQETGWGVSLRLGDNSHNILAVNLPKRTVSAESEDGETLATLPFSDYIALVDPYTWRNGE